MKHLVEVSTLNWFILDVLYSTIVGHLKVNIYVLLIPGSNTWTFLTEIKILDSPLIHFPFWHHARRLYCLFKKPWPNLYTKLPYKMGQGFLVIYSNCSRPILFILRWNKLQIFFIKEERKSILHTQRFAINSQILNALFCSF